MMNAVGMEWVTPGLPRMNLILILGKLGTTAVKIGRVLIPHLEICPGQCDTCWVPDRRIVEKWIIKCSYSYTKAIA